MNKLIIGIIISLFVGFGNIHAQTTMYYYYDDAGNRELRTITMAINGSGESGRIDTTSIAKPEQKIFEETIDELKITIHPNPTQGELKIDISGNLSEITTALYLFDIKGKMIKTTSPLTSSNILDITDKPNGAYVLKIKLGDKVSEWKLVKK